MEQTIFAVSEVNEYIKNMLDTDERLNALFIRGELSNYKVYPSGHHYFTLKDETGALRCVMFRSSAVRLRFRPENGMKVIAFGRITVFPRDGAYQLYCADLTPDGVGDLHVAFEQLKAKLLEEGLFAREHKKPLPPFPHRIAIITSGAGAAIMDMLRILGKRYPLSKVLILPVRVQGAFVSDEEVSAVVGFIKEQNGQVTYSAEMEEKLSNMESANTTVAIDSSADAGDGRDVYFADAARLLMEKEKGSIGMLQRYFKIGFNRAARIMDQLEEAGIVGPEEGTKPRRVLMSPEQFEQYEEEYL